MEFNEFKNLIKKKKGTIFSLVFLTIVLVMIISLLGGLKYSAKSKLLVLQDTGSADAYAVSRSNEYLGNLLSQVVYSGSFFNLVINNPQYKVSAEYFSGTYSERLKLWRKTVSTKTLADTGIIEVSVYHPNPDQARLISLAVNNVLINNNSNYHGGEGVEVSILDQPLVSSYPDQPNLFFNFIFAFFLGIFLALSFIYLYPEEIYNVRLWPKNSGGGRTKKVMVNGPVSIRVETDNIKRQELTDLRLREDLLRAKLDAQAKAEEKIKSEAEVKEELFEKDIFIPNGDISGVLR
ncbi:hypothetical protein JXK06_01635 [Patescibacteria group bacterium]|nr:hypothetical protein [Patescibacteria group bacterium]